jgi:hypothetical protein
MIRGHAPAFRGAAAGYGSLSAAYRGVAMAGLLAWAPAPGGNQGLAAGVYGGTLGAGGATSAERSAIGQNPASLSPGRVRAYAHFHRPFGMEDLQVAEAGCSGDAAGWGLAFDWRRTGVEALYAEQVFQASQTVRLGSTGGFPGVFDLGAVWNGWRREWPGGAARADGSGSDLNGLAWTHGFGAAWRMLPRLKAGAFVLGLPLGGGGPPAADRILQWGFEADSREIEDGVPGPPSSEAADRALQILRLDFRKTGETPWRTLASLSISPHPTVEFIGGLANPPFQASLGIRIAYAGIRWNQSFRHHRYLGSTWLSGLDLTLPIGPAARN